MRSLSVKLVLAFCIVCIVEALLVAFFVRESTRRSFDKFIQEDAIQVFMDDAIAYYARAGNWHGFRETLEPNGPRPGHTRPERGPHARRGPEGRPRPPHRGGPPPRLGNPSDFPRAKKRPMFGLADPAGTVFISNGEFELDDQLSQADLDNAKPLVLDGETPALVLLPSETPPPTPQEQEFLASSDLALFYALGIALSISLLLGFWFTKTSLKPVKSLITATQSLTKGKATDPIPVRSKDEIGTLTQAFNHMNAELQRSQQQRLQMTADIAHELRTPLTVLTGYLEALKDGDLEPSPERMGTMFSEALHLRRLVDDLRLLSLADAGELSLLKENCDLASLLNKVASKFTMQANEASVTLAVHADEAPKDLSIDPDRITQVLSNLISNALRYTPENGQITLSTKQGDNHAFIEVSNTGPGIPADVLPYLFDRFYKADKSRQRHLQTSGLGLAIAKSIVEAHDGSITASSEPGITTFTLSIPA